MQQNKAQVAQLYYLAQLQAIKSTCKCKSCDLLRKAVDAMTEEVLNPGPAEGFDPQAAIQALVSQGYQVTEPGGEEVET